MIQLILIPILSFSLFNIPVSKNTKPPQKPEFQITYISKGRRSPFVSPAEFHKVFAGMNAADRYRAMFEGMTQKEILYKLKEDLNVINTMVDKGKLKDAFKATDAAYQSLLKTRLRGLEAITYEYKKVYDSLIKQINLIHAEETFEKLNIVISGIIHSRGVAQAILDSSNLLEEGQTYKGVKIMRIHKNTIEFNLDGITLIREFNKL